jgi:hypothetical protein
MVSEAADRGLSEGRKAEKRGSEQERESHLYFPV